MSRFTELRLFGARRGAAVSALWLFGGCGACASAAAPIVTAHSTRAPDAPAPAEIATRAELELSGIAWAPSLGRYLVVSDDVRDGRSDKHAPYVYALAPNGELDAAPLAIEGLSALNDPESICAGPEGTFFVTTSHSRDKHGRLPSARRALLLLTLQGHALRVRGHVDLTEARTPDGGTPWREDRPLDVEALAFSAATGELTIGLKSPLEDDGRATLLRMTDAVRVVESGQIPAGAVAVRARVRLCVDGGSICEGVSDVVHHPAGGFLIVANAPKGMPDDGGGALWRVPDDGGAATLIRRFPGSKPEGLTLTPDRRAAVIVFDRDGRQPTWITLPLPS